MRNHYNQLAGQSVERLAALSDGVFAVAMTLLVLDLHTPVAETIHGEADLARALLALAPRLLVYMMSFLTLGIFWVGQQTQLNYLARSDRDLSWIHLGFLFCVTLMPFSTLLIAGFMTYRLALILYWLNILLLGLFLFWAWRYAVRAGRLDEALDTEARRAAVRSVERRIVVAQALYAGGAALCLIDTYVSLGVILLVQLYYAIAPRLRRVAAS